MPRPRQSLMRSLGEFVGHIVRGVKTDPNAPDRRTIRDETQEQRAHDDQGRTVVLRRRTIEEVELRDRD